MTNQTPQKEVSIKCSNPKCSSMRAVEVPYPGGTRVYRCIKCNHTKFVSVGGAFSMGAK